MLQKSVARFSNHDICVIFATSPTGLGHKRVTEALISGLSVSIPMLIVGNDDYGSQFMHRITSTNRIMRIIANKVENTPGLENIFTVCYRYIVKKGAENFGLSVMKLLNRRFLKPKQILIVATHFGLAYQAVEAREKLKKYLKSEIIIAVVITDDSPQPLWAVNGADLIVAPSEYTKNKIRELIFTKKQTDIEQNAYPVNENFRDKIGYKEYWDRVEQTSPHSARRTKIIIPISGAAVQLTYFKDLIEEANNLESFTFTVAARQSRFTSDFLEWCRKKNQIEIISDDRDYELIKKYEDLVENGNFAVEITKPSEQAFKALLTPKQTGGLLLMFSHPIGKQEYDNLAFLRRNGLIPDGADQAVLDQWLSDRVPEHLPQELINKARKWRGLLLPEDNGKISAQALYAFRTSGLWKSMTEYHKPSGYLPEIRDNGVESFWKMAEEKLDRL